MIFGYKNRTAQFELIKGGLINQNFIHATENFRARAENKVSKTFGEIIRG